MEIEYQDSKEKQILAERIIRYTGLAVFCLIFFFPWMAFFYSGSPIVFIFLVPSLVSLIFATPISKHKPAKTFFIVINILQLIGAIAAVLIFIYYRL